MSGDVQPRKRKDKKKKKDDLSVDELRGTAAVFGEGDVLMHSHHEHGTGGHWCAKIIFFSLLAVLVTLIGLIILENRGLSELEANSIESRYSGVLEGWIEDAPEDDHHDEHTLELKHHDHDEDEHGSDVEQEFGEDHDNGDDEEDNDDDHDEEDENDDEDISKEVSDDNDDDDEQEEADEDDQDDGDNESDEQNIEEPEDTIKRSRYTAYDDDDDDDDDDEDDLDKDNDSRDLDQDDNDSGENERDGDENVTNEVDDGSDEGDKRDDESVEDDNENDEDNDDSKEVQNDEDDEDHEEEHDEEPEEEIEKIEREVSDEDEPESVEIPEASVEKEEEASVEAESLDDDSRPDDDEGDDADFLEADDLDEPAVERIAPPPPGKPYVEIDDEVSTETPPDTLAEEEEYEKQQEQLRQEEAQSSHSRQIIAQNYDRMGVWLKLAVGGALLAATHAVIRRAAASRDAPESEPEEHAIREETPLTDRRMTLIPQETPKITQPVSFEPHVVEEEMVPKTSLPVKNAPIVKQDSEEVEDEEVEEKVVEEVEVTKDNDENKELYSDEEEVEVNEDVEEEEELEEKVESPKATEKVPEEPKDEGSETEEVPDDVEIIEDEEIEEEEDEVEEEISDVDDTELLSRLEAKYGRLPEPERPGPKHKDGGNSVDDDWPGEPSDAFWHQQLEKAEQELRQGAFGACEVRVGAAELASSGRAQWLAAQALDLEAEARRDNRLLSRAIAAYLQLLKMNERLSDKKLLQVALRTIDRIHFRGTYLNAEPVYKLLIRRFPNEVSYRNNLTISFLMANRADLATEVLQETLRLWPNDRVALAHYGFVLKTEYNKLEEAVTYFQKALDGDAGAANEPRFFYHLGDALLQLGRGEEAQAVHERGAALGHFLSPVQRSLYNVPRLRSKPWWEPADTPYAKLARALEASWKDILKEGEAARDLYEKEKEGLRSRGAWSQLDVFARGRELGGRCARAPRVCALVRAQPLCRRGQVKFSAMEAGTHVRAHVGPTNCRLRMHLALANTDNTYIRVDQEIRQWEVGKVLMFDDSFEHEVWHNGTGTRLVLIVDVWHPDLTPAERRSLPAI